MKKLFITGLSMAVLCPAFALAQDRAQSTQQEHHSGVYLGANYGLYKARGGNFKDNDRELYEGIVGWQLNQYVGIEANYIDFGKYGNDVARADIDGYGIALTGTIPLSDTFALYAKGGRLWWDGSVASLGERHDQNDETWVYGVGALLTVNDWVGITAEYKRYDMEYDRSMYLVPPNSSSTDIDSITVGARITF